MLSEDVCVFLFIIMEYAGEQKISENYNASIPTAQIRKRLDTVFFL